MSNLNEVKNEYLHMLKDNIIPFWLKNGLDKKHGGYYTALDRKGGLCMVSGKICLGIINSLC